MKIFSVFKATLKSWLRSRSGIFFSFLFPMLLLLVFGTVFGGGGSTRFNLFIQNLDASNGNATQLSTVFIDALNSTNALKIITVPSDVDARVFAQDYSGQFSNYRILVIPEGFHNKTLNNAINIKMNITCSTLNYTLQRFINFIPQNQTESIQMGIMVFKEFLANSKVVYENLTYIYDPSDPAAMTVRGIISSVVAAFNYRLIGASELIRFQYQTFVTRKLNAVDYYMPGYIAAFIMTNGLIGLNSTMTDLRRRGVVKRLLSTPLAKLEWILGNILTQIFIGLLLTLVMVLFSYLIFGVVAIPDALSIIIILVGVVAFSGLGMIFGGIFKNVEASSALGNAIAFPMMFLSGSFWSVEIMPPILQALAKIMPLTYFSDALRNAMIYKEPVNALYNLAILSVLAVIFITIGTILIRWKED